MMPPCNFKIQANPTSTCVLYFLNLSPSYLHLDLLPGELPKQYNVLLHSVGDTYVSLPHPRSTRRRHLLERLPSAPGERSEL